MSTNPNTTFKCSLCKAKMEYKEYSSTCLQCETLWCLDCDSKIGTDPCPACQCSPFIVGIHHRLGQEIAIGVEFADSQFPLYLPLDEHHELPFVHAFSWETKRRVYPKPAFHWILKEWRKVQTSLQVCQQCHQFCPAAHFSSCLACGKAWCADCEIQLRFQGCPSCHPPPRPSVARRTPAKPVVLSKPARPSVGRKHIPSLFDTAPSYESIFKTPK
jgi:hypothetical protein